MCPPSTMSWTAFEACALPILLPCLCIFCIVTAKCKQQACILCEGCVTNKGLNGLSSCAQHLLLYLMLYTRHVVLLLSLISCRHMS